MSDAPISTAVKLAPPGAGLPKPEWFIARLIFGWFRRARSRGDLAAMFEEERERILLLAGSCDPANGTRRTLIKRLPGLEDSSRDWSVFMTLEHLRTAARYRHPWFGPLDAAGWHAMAAFHLRLHRKQVEAILAAMQR